MEKYFCIISTLGFLGKIKYFPGTIGSLIAFPISYIVQHFLSLYLHRQSIKYFYAQITITFLLFIIGWISSKKYSALIDIEDPKEVIIDELVGQLLVINLTYLSKIFINLSNVANYLSQNIIIIIFNYILPFILFRFFDIVKPWPINLFNEHIKEGLGIMLDDIVAALLATTFNYAIIFVIIDFLKK